MAERVQNNGMEGGSGLGGKHSAHTACPRPKSAARSSAASRSSSAASRSAASSATFLVR